jgi:hypothetical protein
MLVFLLGKKKNAITTLLQAINHSALLHLQNCSTEKLVICQ